MFDLKGIPSVDCRWCSYHRKEATSTLKAKDKEFPSESLEFRIQTQFCSVLIQLQKARLEKSSDLNIIYFTFNPRTRIFLGVETI